MAFLRMQCRGAVHVRYTRATTAVEVAASARCASFDRQPDHVMFLAGIKPTFKVYESSVLSVEHGNSDNCDFRFSIADCKQRLVGHIQ